MTALRHFAKVLIIATLFGAVLALFVPRHALAAPATQQSCCAHSQPPQDEDSGDCPMHKKTPAKQKQDEPSCCQACAVGLALLFIAPPSFVYASSGKEPLVRLNTRSESLPHRPPVPPPRLARS